MLSNSRSRHFPARVFVVISGVDCRYSPDDEPEPWSCPFGKAKTPAGIARLIELERQRSIRVFGP